MDDPKNEYVHKIHHNDYLLLDKGSIKIVTAFCGKRWAPKEFVNIRKPRCPECFPPRPQFAVAA